MSHMQEMQEAEQAEQMQYELDIVKRIERGLATKDDAQYVARSFGLTTIKEIQDGNGSKTRRD